MSEQKRLTEVLHEHQHGVGCIIDIPPATWTALQEAYSRIEKLSSRVEALERVVHAHRYPVSPPPNPQEGRGGYVSLAEAKASSSPSIPVVPEIDIEGVTKAYWAASVVSPTGYSVNTNGIRAAIEHDRKMRGVIKLPDAIPGADGNGDYLSGMVRGWNNCLDEIKDRIDALKEARGKQT